MCGDLLKPASWVNWWLFLSGSEGIKSQWLSRHGCCPTASLKAGAAVDIVDVFKKNSKLYTAIQDGAPLIPV